MVGGFQLVSYKLELYTSNILGMGDVSVAHVFSWYQRKIGFAFIAECSGLSPNGWPQHWLRIDECGGRRAVGYRRG